MMNNSQKGSLNFIVKIEQFYKVYLEPAFLSAGFFI